MLIVEADGVRLERVFIDANAQLNDHMPDLLEAMGLRLLALSKIDYVKKGRGGSGSDGVSWKPLDPKTIKQKNRRRRNNPTFGAGASQIGVDTGLQLNSATPGFKAADPQGGTTGNVFKVEEGAVTVGYGRSYSVHFGRVRKLFPDTLPDAWEKALNDIAVDWGYKVLKPVFDTFANQ